MSIEIVGLTIIIVMFILMFLRVPLSVAMGVPAILGIIYLRGWETTLSTVETIVWSNSFSYTLTTIPLFIFMGQFLHSAGLTKELFNTFRKWFGKIRGGLALATVGSSALLAAASGSSVATTGTMGVVAPKEMLKSGYNKTLAGGSVIAGGSLGILIPPSTSFILYGMLTDQSIGKLFTAGLLPGIILMIFYMIAVLVIVKLKPDFAPGFEQSTWSEKLKSLKNTIWILILFLVVIGGIYLGWFSPTEASGIGAIGAFLIALVRKKLTFKNFKEATFETVRTTGFLFAVLLSAFLLNYVLVITRLPNILGDVISSSSLSPTMIFILLILMYLVLGAIMDTTAMIVVTIPIILPLVEMMGWDLIWFGVIIVLLIEMALMSPPIGINCFVLDGVAKDLKLGNIFKGAMIFAIPILVLIAVLYIMPNIALYLPNTM